MPGHDYFQIISHYQCGCLFIHSLVARRKRAFNFFLATNRWSTPWHNVLLKNAQGWQLVKRQEAERTGSTIKSGSLCIGGLLMNNSKPSRII